MICHPGTVRNSTKLKAMLQADGPVYMPGCYDAFSARMIEKTGFKAAAISGFAVETTFLGAPDIGLVTQTELGDVCRRICASVDIPVLTDVDTGFGGVQNIFRTVRLLEQAGIAGFHLEDQTQPKKCPLLPGRSVVSIEEAKDRYAVAMEARTDPDFVIVARSDADAQSYDEQIKRVTAYLEMGVDAVMPMLIQVNGESFYQLDPDVQMEHIARMATDVGGPMMYTGAAPRGYRMADLAQAGVKIISHSLVNLEAAATAMTEALDELYHTGATDAFYASPGRRQVTAADMMELVRVQNYLDLEQRHSAHLK